MNIEAKSFLEMAGWLVSLGVSVGGTIAWVKLKLKNHEERILVLEGKFVTENNEPALLSYRAHDHICNRKSELIVQEFRHVTTALNDNSKAVKTCGEQVANLTVAVAVLEEKVER